VTDEHRPKGALAWPFPAVDTHPTERTTSRFAGQRVRPPDRSRDGDIPTQVWSVSSTRPDIIERIDVGALLKSIGSLQDLELRRTGLGPALQQVVDAAYRRTRSVARSSRRPVAEVARTVVAGGSWGLSRNET